MNHAIVVEESLTNKQVLKYFTILETKKPQKEGDWTEHILHIPDPDLFIEKIQKAMKRNKPFYTHIYNNGISLTIVFKDQIFRVNPNNPNTWINVKKYAINSGFPKEQLDFYPTRIAEEKEWLR